MHRTMWWAMVGLVVMLGCSSESRSAPALHSERTPIRLGLWWDPAHDGSGFEFFRVGDQVALVWYTYRQDGTPVWYQASGRFDEQDTWNAPLFKQRWEANALATPTTVGQLTLTRVNAEELDLSWQLHGREGMQKLQPFPLSGVVPEVDHSGAWHDPGRSGFGMSLTEQGEHLAVGLYFYDASGEPTWRLAENGGRGFELAVTGTLGTCPGCEPRQVQTMNERGWLSLRFDGESALHADYRPAASASWPMSGPFEQLSSPASTRRADRELAAFDDEARLRSYLDGALLRARSTYSNGPILSPAPPATSFSQTNLQVSGVDEADRTKSDGRFLYALGLPGAGEAGTPVTIAESIDDGASLRRHGNLMLPGNEAGTVMPYRGLYLTDAELVVLQGSVPSASSPAGLWMRPDVWRRGTAVVSIHDRSTPSAPTLGRVHEFDAHLVASRRIGNRLHLILRKSVALPAEFEFSGGSHDAARDQRNRDRIAQLRLEEMLPRVRDSDGVWRALVQARDVFLPADGTQPMSPEFVVVATIDLNAPERIEAMAIVGSTAAVYVSQAHAYLAVSRRGARIDPVLGLVNAESFSLTDIYQVALDGERPEFRAAGTLEGFLDRDSVRAPFRFSEHGGKLRVVTVGHSWGTWGVNRLTVLEPSQVSPGLLRTLSYLPNRERPEPLGKPGELLYGTRFVDDRLYAVTFLQTDPLYVVDLSEPAAPRITGAVELPGFSDYLHPVGDSLLLGVGLDARAAQEGWGDGQFAWYQGLMFSLFDVSDPNQPRVLQQRVLGKRGSYSALLRDHHALSALPGGGGTVFALPVGVHAADGSEPVPTPDHYVYPWSWSGLQTLSVSGTDAASARLEVGPALVAYRRDSPSGIVYPDDAATGARSVQFARGIVYVEHGRFWRMDRDGTNVSGPH